MAKITVMFGADPQSEYTLEKDQIKVGRAMDCDLVVDNLGVSRHHCTILKEGDGWAVLDGGSNNGTYVGGQKIQKQLLKHGDKIVVDTVDSRAVWLVQTRADGPFADAVRGLAEGKPWILVVEDGHARRRDVEVGISGDTRVEVVRGVAPGDPVIPAATRVAPGDRVRLPPEPR